MNDNTFRGVGLGGVEPPTSRLSGRDGESASSLSAQANTPSERTPDAAPKAAYSDCDSFADSYTARTHPKASGEAEPDATGDVGAPPIRRAPGTEPGVGAHADRSETTPPRRRPRLPDELQPPTGVQWRVRLPREVASEKFSLRQLGAYAPAGEYEAIVYERGELAVFAVDGSPLGLKAGEYSWVTRLRDLPEVVRLAFGRGRKPCGQCARGRPHGHLTTELCEAVDREVAQGATPTELAAMFGLEVGEVPEVSFDTFAARLMAEVSAGLALGPLDVGAYAPGDTDAEERLVTLRSLLMQVVLVSTKWRLARQWMTSRRARWQRLPQGDDGLHVVMGDGHVVAICHRWTDADFLVSGIEYGDQMMRLLLELVSTIPLLTAAPPRVAIPGGALPLSAEDLTARIAGVHARHSAAEAELARIRATTADVPMLPEVARAITSLQVLVQKLLNADADSETVLIGTLTLDAEARLAPPRVTPRAVEAL